MDVETATDLPEVDTAAPNPAGKRACPLEADKFLVGWRVVRKPFSTPF